VSDHFSQTDIGPTSAVVSLLYLVLSFLQTTHVWLHNVTLLVSLFAGVIAIYAGIKKLSK
jgi:hypothetical protein